jgi:SAM-dependent methyltransferase
MYLTYQGWFEKIRFLYFNKILKKYNLSSGMKLLDFGCGPGDMLIQCQKLGILAFGVDEFERSVRLASERGLNVHLADHNNLPFEENFFDVIFMQSVLEHIKDPIDAVLKLKRNLKPGGILILSTPTPGPHFWDDPTHIRPYTPKSFKTLSEICDFKLLEVNYVFSFLLGIRLQNSLFYKLMNVLPFSLGSNIIGVFRKNHNE